MTASAPAGHPQRAYPEMSCRHSVASGLRPADRSSTSTCLVIDHFWLATIACISDEYVRTSLPSSLVRSSSSSANAVSTSPRSAAIRITVLYPYSFRGSFLSLTSLRIREAPRRSLEGLNVFSREAVLFSDGVNGHCILDTLRHALTARLGGHRASSSPSKSLISECSFAMPLSRIQ